MTGSHGFQVKGFETGDWGNEFCLGFHVRVQDAMPYGLSEV